MKPLADVIADLAARDLHAQAWDDPTRPGGIVVGSEVSTIPVEGGDLPSLKHAAFVVPAGQARAVQCGYGGETVHPSFGEAIEAAAALVCEMRDTGVPETWLGLAGPEARP